MKLASSLFLERTTATSACLLLGKRKCRLGFVRVDADGRSGRRGGGGCGVEGAVAGRPNSGGAGIWRRVVGGFCMLSRGDQEETIRRLHLFPHPGHCSPPSRRSLASCGPAPAGQFAHGPPSHSSNASTVHDKWSPLLGRFRVLRRRRRPPRLFKTGRVGWGSHRR